MNVCKFLRFSIPSAHKEEATAYRDIKSLDALLDQLDRIPLALHSMLVHVQVDNQKEKGKGLAGLSRKESIFTIVIVWSYVDSFSRR